MAPERQQHPRERDRIDRAFRQQRRADLRRARLRQLDRDLRDELAAINRSQQLTFEETF